MLKKRFINYTLLLAIVFNLFTSALQANPLQLPSGDKPPIHSMPCRSEGIDDALHFVHQRIDPKIKALTFLIIAGTSAIARIERFDSFELANYKFGSSKCSGPKVTLAVKKKMKRFIGKIELPGEYWD